LASDRTAIIGDKLPRTRWALVDGFGYGGASIITMLKLSTLNSQLSTPNAFGAQLPDITDIPPDK
jgi:hypothetical protein